MKLSNIVGILAMSLVAVTSRADIIVPGADGSDGPLTITKDTVIDLSQAITGKWDTNNAANSGKGVYDPEKWAVVFKYSEVNIAQGATVRFMNNASRAPVVWLVTESAVINGNVNLDGQAAQGAPKLAEPGPGGFRGGSGYYSPTVKQSAGFGVGGGGLTGGYQGPNYEGTGGTYFGNPSCVPLIGGAGGAAPADGNGAGAGGGAIAIFASKTIEINGSVTAHGGAGVRAGVFGAPNGGSGSGGSIRLVSDGLAGNGSIGARPGPAGNIGSSGKIRIERVTNIAAMNPDPFPDPSVIDLTKGSTALVWPPSGAPEARVISVGGRGTPTEPQAGFGTIGADVSLPIAVSVLVIVETKNVETNSVVQVRGTPRSNGNYTEVPAALDASFVSLEPGVLHWKAELPVNVGYSAVQVKVKRP